MNDRRFAGSIGTNEAGNFSLLNGERHVVNRFEIAVSFSQALDGNEHRDTVREESIRDKLFVALSLAAAVTGDSTRQFPKGNY
jgi:hypothetical protein